MKRRQFLKATAALGASTLLPNALPPTEAARIPGGSILDLPAAQAPIDTIVVLMMENRSFDHYLGWLAEDETYMERGRSLYGGRFKVNASNQQSYAKPNGTVVDTFHLNGEPGVTNPYRGCPFGDPGHSWNAGRAQRDNGFLAAGTGNDELAVGYYLEDDLPFYASIARRFTIFDRYHCSLLGPTYPNREYMHSASSGGIKNNAFPFEVGYSDGFTWATIWDKLMAANVPARYYYSDLPFTLLFGSRLNSIQSPIANFFADAQAGTLPNVVFVDPAFIGDGQSDEHPLGDVRQGQRFVWQVIKALVESPQWARTAMFCTYDEWGGFFDHVKPVRFRDARASANDAEDFRRGGFRVPARMLSPYARENFVDHQLYDHTSILRFIEWRFLGAPAHGAGRSLDRWYLAKRDRFANNIGLSLKPDSPNLEFDTGEITGPPVFSPACEGEMPAPGARSAIVRPPSDFQRGVDLGYWERMGLKL